MNVHSNGGSSTYVQSSDAQHSLRIVLKLPEHKLVSDKQKETLLEQLANSRWTQEERDNASGNTEICLKQSLKQFAAEIVKQLTITKDDGPEAMRQKFQMSIEIEKCLNGIAETISITLKEIFSLEDEVLMKHKLEEFLDNLEYTLQNIFQV